MSSFPFVAAFCQRNDFFCRSRKCEDVGESLDRKSDGAAPEALGL